MNSPCGETVQQTKSPPSATAFVNVRTICPDMFIMLIVLLRVQIRKCSGVFGINCMVFTAISIVADPDIAVDLYELTHSAFLRFHILTVPSELPLIT
ncbi:hypothetical protein DERP_000082 [Dermatophagoides pteronyssinus]|uniref:Uncharacterized protein n=1 Tax=Dermatophagoides pteronyssinus TaxID=6956 RepID=A0ABQ8IZ56_DERPT|nr:hypothetical protein DERP_000082 [Dermatophagoides pteronyssinus]